MPADDGSTDCGSDVIVPWRDVRYERTQSIERRLVTDLAFFFDLQLYLIKRYMTWTFNHYLNIIFPRLSGQFAERFQFGKLGGITRIGETARPQAIAERKADIVFLKDLADVVEVLIEEVLFVIFDHPLGENGATTTDNSGDALRGQ